MLLAASAKHPDHPRSRGVYRVWNTNMDRDCGSSPLARGLLAIRGVRMPHAGIIPARAGFTEDDVGSAVQPEDHPRSRGVYRIEAFVRGRHLGSSPLARGLLKTMWVRPFSRRIIPARAGFTLWA